MLALNWLYKKFWVARRFKKIFSVDNNAEFHVIYPLHHQGVCSNCNEHSRILFPKPQRKNGQVIRSGAINLSKITSMASAKSVGYIVSSIVKNTKNAPQISSDIDVDEKMNISFVSLGAFGNFKSLDLFDDLANEFYHFDYDEEQISYIRKRKTGEKILGAKALNESNSDYGIIVKIHPSSNPDKTWICCAGFGIWGTSGAAYLLSYKWREILKWAGDEPFGCITKTIVGSDDSTEIIEKISLKEDNISRLKKELHKFIQRIR